MPVEETIFEIQERYLVHNAHAGSYTWKRLGKPLNMEKTLDENGMEERAFDLPINKVYYYYCKYIMIYYCSCEDETQEFLRLSIDPDNHVPVIHLHFNDDLTEALH